MEAPIIRSIAALSTKKLIDPTTKKTNMRSRSSFIAFLFPALIWIATSCNTTPEKGDWLTELPMVGSYSSPRAVDLNGDGVLDIVMGAGGREDHPSDTAVIAVDGASGKLLWSLPGVNQYVGSARFKDVNNDGTPDVFIGGRWATFTAINGRSGNPLWTFFPQRTQPNPADSGWYNFTTPQFVPDQDGDALDDLLIANGGNAMAAPYDTVRPAGKLLVISSRTGTILANVTVPDGRETYMSVVCLPTRDGTMQVLFGTGGETIGGHLYRTTLEDIMKGDISKATILAGSSTKGFIAPPLFADVTADGVEDIVVNTVDGRMLTIDGKTDALLWQLHFPNTEAYTTPAVGYFTSDSVPDFFCNFAIGTFPALTRSIRFMVDGKSGAIAYQDTIPAFQYASPVTVDFDSDGTDDVLMYQSEMKRKQFEDVYFSYLRIFDFKNSRFYAVGDTLQATNLAATPWLGDLDNDQRLDIIYSAVKFHDVTFDLQQPRGLFIGRYATEVQIKKNIAWGAYMGSNYTGIFPLRER